MALLLCGEDLADATIGLFAGCRYTEATSQWTLDYPPFFAYFEWALAELAAAVDPGILALQSEPLKTLTAETFLRLSVIGGDAVLFVAAAQISRQIAQPQHAWVPFALVVTNSALLIVDHVHFQYNGLLLGVLLLSLAAHLRGQTLLGGIIFAILLNLKHLYLVLAPVQFVYILRSWVWGRGWPGRLVAMGGAVAAVFAASIGPIAETGQLQPLLRRCAISRRCISLRCG